MDLGEIIAFLIALPAIIIGAIILIVNWLIEGTITDALLTAFDVSPMIGIILTILGVIALIVGLSKLLN